MGKRTKTRKRGKGSPKYRSASHKYKTKAHYRAEKPRGIRGIITDLKKDVSKNAVLMQITWEDGKKNWYIAPEGVKIDENIVQGGKKVSVGNILELADIPEGVPVFNIEAKPGDGGKFARSSGSTASVVAKQKDKVMIRLPSKKTVPLHQKCKATIGVPAGGGRIDKPMLKAGKNYHQKKARSHVYPKTRGVAMNPVAHPHGGSQHHAGKATTRRRTTPPGRKIGHIAAKRTGRKKKK